MMSWKPSGEESMCRKRHEPIPPTDLDEPFGPPPEEYLYRCSVCGEEMLVNEAIIDVAIGAAKFRGEYTGRMPTLGCPGCNGETMAYVEPEP
jgi:DNA-directed RNA polymerase subunit RPC12/RpoP